ncbi:MAG: hypothetical protein N2109_12300 [Fimbriimonadales bacterium]|nr:hypothetical protein [Fimbriimonadales bacterium]
MEPTPAPARKAGLETPLSVRFLGERAVAFAPSWGYDALIVACLLSPLVGGFRWWVGSPLGFMHPGIFFGATVAAALAGVWALFSMDRMVCDLRRRTYLRFEGSAAWKRVRRGSLDELDALVLTCEQLPSVAGGHAVVYRLVLHWKGGRLPPLVGERRLCHLPAGAPLNYSAAPWVDKGLRVAAALRVPFYDNSYFHSPCPIPPI